MIIDDEMANKLMKIFGEDETFKIIIGALDAAIADRELSFPINQVQFQLELTNRIRLAVIAQNERGESDEQHRDETQTIIQRD